MSCRHSLANTTCSRCYPDMCGLDSNGKPQVDLAEKNKRDLDTVTERRDAARAQLAAVERERDELKAREEADAEYLRGILRDIDEKSGGLAVCLWCALPTKSDDESKRQHQVVCAKNPVAAQLATAREALKKVRRNIERDHAKCCAKTHLGIGCLWCETVIVIDAAAPQAPGETWPCKACGAASDSSECNRNPCSCGCHFIGVPQHQVNDLRSQLATAREALRSILGRHDLGHCTCGGCSIARAALSALAQPADDGGGDK